MPDSFNLKELLQNKAVQIALAVVAVIVAGSLAYYLIESQPPKVSLVKVSQGNIVEDVTVNGLVSPVQNPTLSFEVGGQVRTVQVAAGQKVTAGSFLAALDTGILSASMSAAEAKLNQLESGPRDVDVAGLQTSVLNAQQTLSNIYTNYPQSLLSSLNSAQSAINTRADALFDFSNSEYPVLLGTIQNPSVKVTVDTERIALNREFAIWQSEISTITNSATPDQLRTATAKSIQHLETIRSFLDDLIGAINQEQVATSVAHIQQVNDLGNANAALTTINGLITSLTNEGQSITTQQLAVQSAQNQLDQVNAGAAIQDIQAQRAQVAGIQAQLRQQEIIAPFTGTVASVSIKPGDAVSANTPAISLIPNGTFEVDLYLAENDVAKVKIGDKADVMLDAYGVGQNFPATVGTVEASPSIDPHSNGGTSGGYKVTLIFDSADPSIVNGMHASAIIHAGSAQNTLIVPSSAIITNGTSKFVLKQMPQGLVKTPVTVGLSGATTTEILSGLVVGDTVSVVGAQ